MPELVLCSLAAILISAWCSMLEASFYSVPASFIEHLRTEGKRSGQILHKLRSDIDKPISAILILNTVANTAGASLAGAIASRELGSEMAGYFAALFTLLVLFFSEIVPKTVGVAYARTIAPLMARPLRVIVVILWPFIWVTSTLTRVLKPRKTRSEMTEDDIRAIVALTRRSGVLKPYEEQTIMNLLLMDLKTVSDIMTPRTVVFSLAAESTVAEAKISQGFWIHSRVPVYKGEDTENVVGICYRRDVLTLLAEDHFDTTIEEIMRPARFVLSTLTLDRLLVELLESRVHLFVVLDEYGGMEGVVSLEDVVEEMLGKEIVDETDRVEDLQALARARKEQLTKARERLHNKQLPAGPTS
ncbi:hemolysin family protein [Megalodesulfovibrio paquesii]